MYLRNVMKKANMSSLYKTQNKRFALLDNLNVASFRMTKYDPTKEIEVNLFKNYRVTNRLYSLKNRTVDLTKSQNLLTV